VSAIRGFHCTVLRIITVCLWPTDEYPSKHYQTRQNISIHSSAEAGEYFKRKTGALVFGRSFFRKINESRDKCRARIAWAYYRACLNTRHVRKTILTWLFSRVWIIWYRWRNIAMSNISNLPDIDVTRVGGVLIGGGGCGGWPSSPGHFFDTSNMYNRASYCSVLMKKKIIIITIVTAHRNICSIHSCLHCPWTYYEADIFSSRLPPPPPPQKNFFFFLYKYATVRSASILVVAAQRRDALSLSDCQLITVRQTNVMCIKCRRCNGICTAPSRRRRIVCMVQLHRITGENKMRRAKL